MTTATNTTENNQTAITAFLSEDAPGDNEVTFSCELNEAGEIVKAARTAYTVDTKTFGETPSEGEEFSNFEDAWNYFVEIYGDSDDDRKEDFEETADEVEVILNQSGEFTKTIGHERRVDLRLIRSVTNEPLVDAPIYEDADGREIMICHEDVANLFVVRVKNLNGTFSVCSLDGEVCSSVRSWRALDRVPERVREDVEAVWEVSA